MDSNIKELITNSVKELSRVNRGTTTLTIWGGLGLNRSDGTMFVCKTDGSNNIIYGAKKSAYKQWKNGTYVFSREDMDNTRKMLGLDTIVPKNVVSVRTRASIINSNEALIKELTFFLNEVSYCSINPASKLNYRDGIVLPNIHEIQVDVIDPINRSFDTRSVNIVLKTTANPADIYTVPKGGGISPNEFDYDELGFNFNINTEGIKGGHNLSARISKANEFISKQNEYDHCFIRDKERPRIGDVWYNGLRSSISNGIYELWADDIGAGPMLRASRTSVQEAAARYKKDINPINQRYATTRVNPMADKFASNSITPVKMYIDNWWEDPQVYAGIIAALFALMRSTGDNRDSFEFSQDFIDAGAFDYDKMYKPLNGTEA
jgi:hypothetical protein